MTEGNETSVISFRDDPLRWSSSAAPERVSSSRGASRGFGSSACGGRLDYRRVVFREQAPGERDTPNPDLLPPGSQPLSHSRPAARAALLPYLSCRWRLKALSIRWKICGRGRPETLDTGHSTLDVDYAGRVARRRHAHRDRAGSLRMPRRRVPARTSARGSGRSPCPAGSRSDGCPATPAGAPATSADS